MNEQALQIRSFIRANRMAEDVKALVALGPRHAGTEREHQAAEYIAKQFASAGTNVRQDRVAGIAAWKLNDCRVKVVEPVEQELTTACRVIPSLSGLAAREHASWRLAHWRR